jgi:hypothetical protein
VGQIEGSIQERTGLRVAVAADKECCLMQRLSKYGIVVVPDSTE